MTWELSMENIAGIRDGDATLTPGVNAIRGSNWQGKSSFLAAIETAMGVETALTEGAERGRVEFSADGDAHIVELVRDNGTVVRDGDRYLSDEYDIICANLYAFLDENNPVRRAVRNGDNLEALLTRPLDFENIDARIADRKRERERVDTELTRAQEADKRLPAVTERVTKLEADLEELRNRRNELGESDADTEGVRDELSDRRAERDDVRNRVERLERSVERARDELDSRRAELAEVTVPTDEDVETELAEARTELREAERDTKLLQSLYGVTNQLLEEDRLDLLTDVDRNLLEDTFACWLCGDETDREEVAARLDEIGDRASQLQTRTADVRERVEALEDRRDEIAAVRRKRTDFEDRIADLEATVSDRETSLASARDRLAELDDEVDAFAADVGVADEQLVDIESEFKYTEARLEDAREELSILTAQADKQPALEAERGQLTDEIESLRNRKDELKRRARTEFDEALQEILTPFDTGFETARLTPNFELVVARGGREASLDALSEGELELLGFVAALAGHAAFEVAERVPIMLLDRLGGLADENLHTLVDCLHDRAEYLVVTAYPEHGAFDGREIDPAAWTVVSNDSTV